MNDIQYICLFVTMILNKQQNLPIHKGITNLERTETWNRQERLLCPISFHLSLLRFLSFFALSQNCSADRLTFTCLLSLNRFDLNSMSCHHRNVQTDTETDTHSESWTRDVGNTCVRIHKTRTHEEVRVWHINLCFVPRYMSPDCRLCTETDFSLSLEQWDGDTVCRVGSQTHNRDVSNLLCFLGEVNLLQRKRVCLRAYMSVYDDQLISKTRAGFWFSANAIVMLFSYTNKWTREEWEEKVQCGLLFWELLY